MITLLLSMVPVFFIFASVSVGAWIEQALHVFGYRQRPLWQPAVLGVLGYTGLGVAGPAAAATCSAGPVRCSGR